jgi:hypothetical protein
MNISGPSQRSGSVLLATMIFVLAIAAFLVTYLYVVQNSNQSVARAQRWNAALAVAEAGIEEGMAKLNQVAITTMQGSGGFTDVIERGLNGDTYAVGNTTAGIVQTLTSTGTVSAPIVGGTISRIVRVNAQRQALFSKGMIAMNDINMNGNGVISDSFDSHNTNQSVNGAYSSSFYAGTNGDIAAVNGVVNIGNHTIGGDLYLGPYSTFPRGNVLGTVYTDWNMQYPPAALPTLDSNGYVIAWTAEPVSASHTFTNSGYYVVSDEGGITVAPGVTATVRITRSSYSLTSLNIQGGTTNAGTLIMYQDSGSVTLGGSAAAGAVNNRPENFIYYGLPGVTQVTMGGKPTFVGVIYAPNAVTTLNGGGSGLNYIGSVVVKSITVNGHFELHYDTSLEGLYYGYYAVGYWQEL